MDDFLSIVSWVMGADIVNESIFVLEITSKCTGQADMECMRMNARIIAAPRSRS